MDLFKQIDEKQKELKELTDPKQWRARQILREEIKHLEYLLTNDNAPIEIK